jgi:hypothetical protein
MSDLDPVFVALGRQILREDMSEEIGASRGLADLGVAWEAVLSDERDERELGLQVLVRYYEREIIIAQLANSRPRRRRWLPWRR